MARATAAAAAREVWLLEKVEASVFARVLQDIEEEILDEQTDLHLSSYRDKIR